MKPSRVIWSTFLLFVTIQTIGSVDSTHRLPAPRKFVAVSVLWGIMFFMVDLGAGKIASRLSLLILLTGMVTGPFGKTVLGFLGIVSKNFPVDPNAGITGTTGIPGTQQNAA